MYDARRDNLTREAHPPPSAGKSPVLMSKSETGGRKMKTRYFSSVNCIEELKRQYFALAKLYHSDITGGDEQLQLNGAF